MERDSQQGGLPENHAHDTRLQSEPSAKTEPRRYHVLEERDLSDVVRELLDTPTAAAVADMLRGKVVFDLVAVTDARNPETAVRNAAKVAASRSGQMHLIAVADRMFQPLAVRVR